MEINNFMYLNKIQVYVGIKNTSVLDSEKYRLTKNELKKMFRQRIQPIHFRVLIDALYPLNENINSNNIVTVCLKFIDNINTLNDCMFIKSNIGDCFMERLIIKGPVVAMMFLLNHFNNAQIERSIIL